VARLGIKWRRVSKGFSIGKTAWGIGAKEADIPL